MTRYSILLKALEAVRPRWWGDFTPAARGPVIHAETAPIPLPSTVAGALAALLGGASACSAAWLKEDPLACQREVLKKSEVSRLGPAVLVACNDECRPLLPVSQGPGRVSLVDLEGRVYEVRPTARIGVGLRRDRKAANEGLLYSEELAWAVLGEDDNAYPYAIAVEVESESMLQWEGVVRLGGEGALFSVRQLREPVLELWLKRLWGDGWARPVEKLVAVVVSPLVVEDVGEGSTLKPYTTITDLLAKALRARDVEPVTRCTVAGLGLGYDMATNLPRPYKPVILPGCAVEAELANPRPPSRVYSEEPAHTLYHELGWSWLVPLPLEAKDWMELG